MSSKKAVKKALAKIGSKKSGKALVKAGEKDAGLGKTGHKVVQAMGQLAAGVATKNIGRVAVPFTSITVAPDEALTAAGAALFFGQSLFGLGKAKAKWAEDAMWAGIGALIGRYTWGDTITVTKTKDGGVEIKQGNGPAARAEEAAPPPRNVNATINVDPETGKPTGVHVESRAA